MSLLKLQTKPISEDECSLHIGGRTITELTHSVPVTCLIGKEMLGSDIGSRCQA
jgi:hypothetical protein